MSERYWQDVEWQVSGEEVPPMCSREPDSPAIHIERRPETVAAVDGLHRAERLSRLRLRLEEWGWVDRRCVECRKPWPCPTYCVLKPWRRFVLPHRPTAAANPTDETTEGRG